MKQEHISFLITIIIIVIILSFLSSREMLQTLGGILMGILASIYLFYLLFYRKESCFKSKEVSYLIVVIISIISLAVLSLLISGNYILAEAIGISFVSSVVFFVIYFFAVFVKDVFSKTDD